MGEGMNTRETGTREGENTGGCYGGMEEKRRKKNLKEREGKRCMRNIKNSYSCNRPMRREGQGEDGRVGWWKMREKRYEENKKTRDGIGVEEE